MNGYYVVLCLVGSRVAVARDGLGRPVGSSHPILLAFLAYVLEWHGAGRALLLPGAALDDFLRLNGLEEEHTDNDVALLEEEAESLRSAVALAESLAPRIAAAWSA